MTTDITELAQREKFEYWARSQQLSLAYGDCGYFYSSTEMAWRAVKAQSAELVEALEKAQQRNGELETYSKTALEFREAARDENRHLKLELEIAEKRIAELEEAERKLCAANVTLDARAEQAERERENWRTSFDNERFRADKLKAYIDDIEPIRAAAEKLVRCKGRYHSELNYRTLAALFGVTTPDLPPLEHENVHYADAAEMEIAALRQRIAELESRTVKLPKPISVLHRREFTEAHCAIYAYPEAEVNAALDDAGIKVEAE